MDATLYGMSISHPARAAGLMLRHKDIEAKIVNLPVGSQIVSMRALGFRGGTVPGLKVDGRRVQGTREISRFLDELVPEPPLFPAEPALRAAVEEAERWGDEVYQPVPRRIFRWSMATDSELRGRLLASVGVPLPGLASRAVWPLTQYYLRAESGGEEAVRADLEALPGHIDHVDELIAAGTIDGEELNAADFQIATTSRVLLNFKPLRPLLEGRPAAAHAMRVAPDFGREAPIRLPREVPA
jgi:glutathione S-transferase